MIKPSAKPESKRGVADSFGDVVSDVASLAELQFDLFRLDCVDSKRRLAVPALVIGAGLLLLAGVFPVLLLLVSSLLHEFAELSISASVAISLAIGIVVGGLTLWLGFRGFVRAMAVFERSSEELKRNVQWLKNLKKRNRQADRGFNRGSLNRSNL